MSRESILSLSRRPRQVKEIEVPGLDEPVYIRSMTGLERERLENRIGGKDNVESRARMVAAACCDKDGKLLFTEMDVSDLNAVDWRILHKIKEAIEDFNAITPAAVDKAVGESVAAS